MDDILKKYPNDVQIVIKNFPLSFHKQAKQAARYALAANAQGKYMEMYFKIFENFRQLKTNPDMPIGIAKELGLNEAAFLKAYNDPATEAQIDKEMEQFKNSGIPRLAVPKFLINGKEPQGRSVEAFSKIIDAELKKKKKG